MNNLNINQRPSTATQTEEAYCRLQSLHSRLRVYYTRHKKDDGVLQTPMADQHRECL